MRQSETLTPTKEVNLMVMNFLFQSFQALLKFLLDETESHLIKHKNSYIISMKKMVQRPIFLFAHICLNTHTLLDD